MAPDNTTTDILIKPRGNAGLITLNRLEALSSLSLQMVRHITAARGSEAFF